MNFAFRADASHRIGTGHIVRCLTLARQLRAQGHGCRFLTGELPGHAVAALHDAGFRTGILRPAPADAAARGRDEGRERPAHADWLGGDWRADAAQCRALLDADRPDWIVVDHYALDTDWEREMAAACGRICVIDDLADRRHDCDLLLDQNLGRRAADYDRLVPPRAERLIGPHYALLRPEFQQLRAQSLARRERPTLRRILVFMGGRDPDNATGDVLAALALAPPASGVEVTVVMGRDAAWLDAVSAQAASLPVAIDVRAGVENMAELMAAADLAIGAAGGAAWERCCLGLPSIVVVLAGNQRPGAAALAAAGAALVLDGRDEIAERLPAALARMAAAAELAEFSRRAAAVTDGGGAARVAMHLCEGDREERDR